MLFFFFASIFSKGIIHDTPELTKIVTEHDLYNNKGENKNIVIITREGCGWSRKMREVLDEDGILYTDMKLQSSGMEMKTNSTYEKATFPAVFIDGEYIGGYSKSMENPRFKQYVREHRGETSKNK